MKRVCKIGEYYKLVQKGALNVTYQQCLSISAEIEYAEIYIFTNGYELDSNSDSSNWDIYELSPLEKALI